MVDVGIREQQCEPDLVEPVSACPRLVEKTLEESEGFVETGEAYIAPTQCVGSGGRVARCKLAGGEGLLEQRDPLRNVAPVEGQLPEPELRSREGCG